MFQRSGQFPGYTIQEMLDSPRHYERYTAIEHDTRQWVVIRALSRDLAGAVEIRMLYQDACRQYAHAHVDGLFEMREIGTNKIHGVYAVYAYKWAYMTCGEIAASVQKANVQMSPQFCVSVLMDATQILHEAWLQKLEHFAVSTNYINVSEDGETHVTGFVDALMRRRFRLDTELDEKFDAPEWRRCEPVGVESDVYAIAALLFQGITNEFQPDEWEPRWTSMMDILARANIPGDSLSTTIQFFQKALAERPAQRYHSYQQLYSALEHLSKEFGGYMPPEVRAEFLQPFFEPYPPSVSHEIREQRQDIIQLITGETPNPLSDLSCGGLEPIENTADVQRQKYEDGRISHASNNSNLSCDETLTAPSAGLETRIIQRSSNSFRTINPALRASITASPLEVLARSRYQILDQLGIGGTGTVYKVLDTTLTEVLALKVLRPDLVSDSAWLQRFKRELKIARDLEHAYILPAYHLEQLEGLYFFTMRYIQGKNLSEHLHESSLPIMMSLRILTQVAEALVAAHDRGIIHRDLKPANIMIEDDTWHPYLMDFGIASMLDTPSVTIAGQGIGTPFYMAPEQSRGEAITLQADVYSFGVVCYECFTQRLPFTGPTAIAIYNAQMSGIFEPIRDINPNVPSSIAQLVESCLAPKASDRPSSMRIVLDGLSQI